MAARPHQFPTAIAAGLVQLGGRDVLVGTRTGQLRGHHWTAPDRPSPLPPVVICPGFTEFCEKYAAVAARLTARGHDVLIIDWPGQGRSGHLGELPLSVHIDDFQDHLAAADSLMTAVGMESGQVIFLGHSMGGHLALRLAARHLARTVGAIVMSPMIAPPVMPVWGVRLLARVIIAAGFGRRPALGRRPRTLDEERVFHDRNGLTRLREGYEAQFLWFDDAPELRRSGPTAGWVLAAYDSCVATTLDEGWMRRLKLPVLAMTAGDESIVHKRSTDRMIPFLPDCRHVCFDGARHELFNETEAVRNDVWDRIGMFLDSIGS